jgi:DNA invertase Pin-like site-specific DNA recombinase
VLSCLKRGDSLVVWRLDRLCGSLKELIETLAAFDERGVRFISLTEKIDTAIPTCGVIDLLCALSAFEANLITERTKAGIEVARKKGKRPGRPPLTPNSEKVVKAKCLFLDPKNSLPDILKTLNISKATLHRYLNLGGNMKTDKKATLHPKRGRGYQ